MKSVKDVCYGTPHSKKIFAFVVTKSKTELSTQNKHSQKEFEDDSIMTLFIFCK